MLDPSIPQKRIQFPKHRKAVARPVSAPVPRAEPVIREVRSAPPEPVIVERPREPEPIPAPEPVKTVEPAPAPLPRAPAAAPAPAPREVPSVRPQALPEASERPMSAWRVVLVTLLTAAASFALVRFLIVPNETPEGPALASTAPPTVTPAPVAKKKPKKAELAPAALSSEDTELPADAVIDADKGLLEIDIGEKKAIYVDGTFVGMGPRRRVPLAPGKHEVKLREGGDETTHAVDVRAGRSTRLSKKKP